MTEKWGSLADLERATGFARRTLQYIRKREPGVLVTRRRRGRVEYDIGACNVRLRRREGELAKKKAGGKTDATIAELERRKMAADARYAEVRIELLERGLVPVEESVRETEDLLLHLRSVLLAHPKTRDVANEILEQLRERPPPEVDR